MIIFPQSLLLSELLTQPLTHPRIGWQTWTFDLDANAVAVSSETASGPRDAPLRAETVQFWEPSTLPATWDLDFGVLRDLDYVGLLANFGSAGVAVEARISEDVADFNDYLSLSGVDANYASTPDSVANSITGDLHVELELAIDDADLPDFSLDFLGDFAASVTKITDDGTFTRAGDTATRVTSAGVVASVLANVMRQDFNPITRAVRGLLVEESRQNKLLNALIDGTNLSTQDVTVTAVAHTLSFYGTGTVTLSGASSAGPLVGTGDYPARVALTFTPSAATLTLTVSGDVKYAQLETGSFATSFVPTAGSAVTRAADVATLTDLTAMGFSASEGTIIAAAESPNHAQTGLFSRIYSFNDGTGDEEFYLARDSGLSRAFVRDGGVEQVNPTLGTWADAASRKANFAYKANDFAGSFDGGAVVTDSAGTIPTVDQLSIGASGAGGGSAFWNGWLREFFYYVTRRVNDALVNFSRQTYRCLASKWAETSDQRSWALCLKESCALVLFVSIDGTAAGIREYHSAPLTVTEGARFRIRVKLDIASGADSVCTFQTSDDDGATWDTLSTVTQASVSGLFDSTAAVEVGAFNGGTSEFQGKVFQFWLHADLTDGPVIHFDAAEGETGDTSIVSEDTGETWTIHSTGPATALTIKRFAAPIAPGDDAPILMLDDVRSARRLRLRLTGVLDPLRPPRLAVVYAGQALAMQREVDGNGFAPLTLSRETELTQPLSRGGQFLGQNFKRFGVKGEAAFSHLDPDWYRTNFDPFVRHARRQPYFFAWWPAEYPQEVGFVWNGTDIAPSYMGVRDWMQVRWAMHGIGNE